MLLTIREAAELCGRSAITIRDWHFQHGLRVYRRPGGYPEWLVDTRELRRVAIERITAYRNRRIVPGPGRGHTKKVDTNEWNKH